MAMWKIDVFAPPVRDPKQETELYTIPDPKNWEEYYAQQERAQLMPVIEFMKSRKVELSKGIAIKKGASALVLEVNDHLLAYLQADRNIIVRVLGEMDGKSVATELNLQPKRRGRKPKELATA